MHLISTMQQIIYIDEKCFMKWIKLQKKQYSMITCAMQALWGTYRHYWIWIRASIKNPILQNWMSSGLQWLIPLKIVLFISKLLSWIKFYCPTIQGNQFRAPHDFLTSQTDQVQSTLNFQSTLTRNQESHLKNPRTLTR